MEQEEKTRLVIAVVFDGTGINDPLSLIRESTSTCVFSYEIVFDRVTTLKKVVPCGATLELLTWGEVQINNRRYSFDPVLKATL